MENHMALIWQRIDGSLDQDSYQLFEHLLSTDNDFKSLYEKQLSLHKSLTGLTPKKAPKAIIPNVMNQLFVNNSIAAKYNSFKGLGYFLIGLTALAAVIFGIVVYGSFGESGQSYPLLAKVMDASQSLATVSEGLSVYLSYSSGLLAFASLYWIDKYFKKPKVKISTLQLM